MVDFQRHTIISVDVLRVREEVDQRLGLLVTDQSMPVIVNEAITLREDLSFVVKV